jgi:transposase
MGAPDGSATTSQSPPSIPTPAISGRSHVHLIKLANGSIDDVRRRVQRETTGHRGRKDDPLFGVRHLLSRGWERLSDRQEEGLVAVLHYGDPFDEVGAALVAKEELRQMYTATSTTGARRRLDAFYELARRCGVPEVTRLSRTVRRWEPQILSFFVAGHTPTPRARLRT